MRVVAPGLRCSPFNLKVAQNVGSILLSFKEFQVSPASIVVRAWVAKRGLGCALRVGVHEFLQASRAFHAPSVNWKV